ncbi:RNA polymerase factor sigma-54 [Enterococcus hermanniensis]|uniref:RNA polymerase sigma-54 factor n=1 Tax=Enterococcus hermanniensis TaxID=249189 RepID=A0A1L8TJ32_9ENTE|nr:RNA polymerase factor sigma-54 [Enterococcus hermanniensis]OJG44345.1 RNA polymerase sigma-54 factor [Enterococcus hermanniensis]
MKFQQGYSQKQQQTQKLAMTQELQQAIQILQFNTEELQDYVETISLENPLFDIVAPKMQSDLMQMHSGGIKEESFIQIADHPVSLFEHLIHQINLNYRDTFIREIMLALVENIDINGYLKVDEENFKAEINATTLQFLDALTLLQQLDPPGVGARNLQECLMLQTEQDDYAPNLAYLILEESFDEIAKRKFEIIAKKYQLSLSQVQQIMDYIQSLNPFPGAGFGSQDSNFIIPDLTLVRRAGELVVLSNKRGQLRLNFQENYFNRLKQQADEETKVYLKEKLQQFEWLNKTIGQRKDTILEVGKIIVQQQAHFFETKQGALKPLMLKDIAKQLSVHESTISRAVNGKYIETDFGVFELRRFFVNKVNDEDTSADEVKKLIATFVEEEDKNKPLSDQKIVEMLAEKEQKISRRTVAKYRDALKIPSSSKRKRFD